MASPLGAGQPAPVPGAVSPPMPAALSDRPNAFSLLRALQRRWLLALVVGIFATAGAGTAAFFLVPPAKHTARTLMRVPPGSPFLFRTAEVVPTIQDHQRNQIAAVKSRLVLNNALKQPKVAALPTIQEQPEPLEWLEKEIQADFSVAPEILKISLSGDRPDDLIVIVDAVREAYRKEILDKEQIERTARLEQLGKIREGFEGQLRARKQTLRELEERAGTTKDPAASSMLLAFTKSQLNWFEQELLRTQSDLRHDRIMLKLAEEAEKQTGKPAPVPEAMVSGLLDNDPEVRAAREDMRRIQADIDRTIPTAVGGMKSPAVLSLRKDLAEAEARLAQAKKRLAPELTEQLQQKGRQQIALNTNQLRGRVQAKTADEQALVQLIDGLRKSLQDMTRNGIKLEDAQDNTASLERFTKRVIDEEEALRIELQAPRRYSVLEEGSAPRIVNEKRLYLATALAAIAALGLSWLLIATWEFRVRRVGTPDQLIHGLGMRVVGTIPDATASYVQAGGPAGHDLLAEAVDATRTMLLQAARFERMRVVMITSAHSGEGKTTLSTQLAASLAQVGYRTLLIDGDMRNPLAHRVFDLPAKPGLCEVLRGQIDVTAAIRPTSVSQLAMLPAGRWDSLATRALAQESLVRTLQGLREQFDFVIIDSSPVLPVVDPLLIGQHADATIISVLRDVSRTPTVYAAYQRLTAGGVRVIGAVVNGVRGEFYGASYPYRAYGLPADPEVAEQILSPGSKA